MSKGYGLRQRQIIEHLENAQGNTDTTRNIINKINEYSHPTPSPRSIYNAFDRLEVRKVIFPSKTRNIFHIGSDVRHQQLPETYTLDKESEDYKKYRKPWSHA